MVNELVNSIIEAEKKSVEIIESAQAKAEDIGIEAEKKISEMKKSHENSLKAECEVIARQNQAKADALYQKILDDGKAVSEKTVSENKDKSLGYAEEIARWILSGNC